MMYEMTFLSIYSSPGMLRLGEKFAFERTRKDPKLLRYLPEVEAAILNMDRGGFVEAVIRMLILMADSRATVRRDRLERSARVLGHDEPFASLGSDKRAAIIHEQTLIVEFERERAIDNPARPAARSAERPRDRGRRVHRRGDRGDGARDDPARAAVPVGARPRALALPTRVRTR